MELVQALSIDYSLVCFFDLDTGRGYPLRVAGSRPQEQGENFDGRCAVPERCLSSGPTRPRTRP